MSEETVETKESKIDATHRLQKAGLWDEASAYRTERRIQYRNSGMAKHEASKKAWEDMLSKYPPPGVEPVEPPDIKIPESEPELEEGFVHIPATDMDVSRDIAWAYEHLGNEKVRADQAPSAGAWNMLIYGREARHKFIELVTKYDLSARNEDDEAGVFEAEAADHTKMIEKMLSFTEQIHADAIRDAIRQCPETVVQVLRKAGWEVNRSSAEQQG